MTAAVEPGRELSEVAAESDVEGDRSAFTRSADLGSMHALVRAAGGAVRLTGPELADEPAFRALRDAEGVRSPRGWMAVPLTSLDGRDFGYLDVFDKEDGEFADRDEAVLVHLAQMASAALERALLYRRKP